MTTPQNPPNPGWQPGPQGPGQPFNPSPQPPQGPPTGYQQNFGQQAPQGYGQQPPQGYGQQPPQAAPKAKSKTKAIVAGGVGVAVVAAAVGLGLFFFRGSSPVAAEGLPADVTFAFEANLAPSNADKLALKGIADKFPSLSSGNLETDYKAAVYAMITQESTDAPDYAASIEPWLGDSIAIGFTGDPSDERNLIMAVETTDKGKAEAFARDEGDGARVQFIDDLMVITDENSTLSVDDIKQNALADSEQYKADIGRLGEGNLATLWFGPELLTTALEQVEQESGLDATSIDADALRDAHGAAGLKVSDNKLTAKLVMQAPNAPEASGPDVVDLARSLPGDALAVIAAGTTDEAIGELWSTLETAAGGTDALASFGITGVDDFRALIGSRVGLSIGMDGGMPQVGAKLETDEPEKQKEIFDGIDELLQAGGIPGIAFAQDGNTGIVAYGRSADNLLNPASKVGDLDTFKQVVDGKAQAVVFLNVDALKALPDYETMLNSMPDGQLEEFLAPVSSVGIVGNAAGDHYSESFLHVTFD